MEMEKRLIIGITTGGPASIGPEITVKALSLEKIYYKCRPLVAGDVNVIETAVRIVGKDGIKIHPVHSVDETLSESGTMDVYDTGLVDMDQLERGEVSVMTGEAVFRYVEKVTQMALVDEIDGTATNAFSKEAINLAGHHYSGYTEVHVDMTGTKKYTMMLVHENMRVMHVSTHVSLREACERVKKDWVLEMIHIAYQACRNLGIQQPKIGITGLNPYSGESDLFGREEIEEIVPATEAANGEGIPAEGSVSPDTAFLKARRGWYDMMIAMYHNQGHIPLKVVGFVYSQEQQKWDAVVGVNITLELPIVGASVDHGAAFDQAGQGVANELSLVNAIDYGIRLSKSNGEKTVKR